MLEIIYFMLFVFLAVMSILPWLMLIAGYFMTGLNIKKIDNFVYFEMMNGITLPFWILGITLLTEIISLGYLLSWVSVIDC